MVGEVGRQSRQEREREGGGGGERKSQRDREIGGGGGGGRASRREREREVLILTGRSLPHRGEEGGRETGLLIRGKGGKAKGPLHV